MPSPEQRESLLQRVYEGSLELALRATAAIIEWRREQELLSLPLPPYQPAAERPLIVDDQALVHQD